MWGDDYEMGHSLVHVTLTTRYRIASNSAKNRKKNFTDSILIQIRYPQSSCLKHLKESHQSGVNTTQIPRVFRANNVQI